MYIPIQARLPVPDRVTNSPIYLLIAGYFKGFVTKKFRRYLLDIKLNLPGFYLNKYSNSNRLLDYYGLLGVLKFILVLSNDNKTFENTSPIYQGSLVDTINVITIFLDSHTLLTVWGKIWKYSEAIYYTCPIHVYKHKNAKHFLSVNIWNHQNAQKKQTEFNVYIYSQRNVHLYI